MRSTAPSSITFALAIGLANLAAGCGGDPISRLESEYRSTAAQACDRCPGTRTPAECRAGIDASNPFDGPQWDCQRDVYARYPSELSPFYDCTLRATRDYDRCFLATLSMCPPDGAAVMACGDAQRTAINACPAPTSVEALTALSACFR